MAASRSLLGGRVTSAIRTTMTQQHYTFGDNDRAARRLHRLADAFEPSSRRLLAALPRRRRRLALDLGAGLGRTTWLVHDLVRAERTVGLETSPRFLALARQADVAKCLEFVEHDVTRAPFPTEPADLLYSRFLVTHLATPSAVLATWAAAAAPGAHLVCEETASLESAHPTFSRYYAIVAAMQAHYGQTLTIGRDLAGLVAQAGFRDVEAAIISFRLDAATMAELHAMNIATWNSDPFVSTTYAPDELAALELALSAIARGETPAPPVTCELAQVVARRE